MTTKKDEDTRNYGSIGVRSLEYCQLDEVHTLSKILEDLKDVGDFYSHELTKELPLPNIDVTDVGTLEYPVLQKTVKDIIQKHAVQAPYGKGEETIVDTNVRNVWQIASDTFKIGKEWDDSLDIILKKVAKDLGLGDEKIGANLYKMLIYQKGGFFLEHRDTEKESRMFGTLVISLPCAHKGGELVLNHNGSVVELSLENSGKTSLNYAAFYSDCSHSVKVVTKGYRVCLVYNLVKSPKRKQTDDEEPKEPNFLHNHTDEIGNMLIAAFKSNEEPGELVYVLRHRYSMAGLSQDRLKGHDAKVHQIFSSISREKKSFSVSIGLLKIHQVSWGYEEMETYGELECEFQMLEDPDGKRVDETQDVRADSIFPESSLDTAKPSSSEVEEATGNEGMIQ
eukprot:gene13006-15297_t